MTDEELKDIEERYTIEPGWVPGIELGRHRNEADAVLGKVYRHRTGKDGDYPEIGVVEVNNAAGRLAAAYAERDEYRAAMTDVLKLVKELRKGVVVPRETLMRVEHEFDCSANKMGNGAGPCDCVMVEINKLLWGDRQHPHPGGENSPNGP